ncbi:MAG: PEP-CTERM sorting domain-containing protein [Planctomycetota bacterium]
MKMRILNLLCASLVLSAGAASADTVAYWAFNDQALPGGGFGWETSDLPQAADIGAGSLSVDLGDPTDVGGVFEYLQSFSGTSINDLSGTTGGSIAIQNAPNGGNNGSSILLDVDLSLFSDISISWAQRGTGTGFTSRELSYSTDGGATFTSFGFDGNLGSFGYDPISFDLSSVTALNGAADAVLAITVDGGSLTSTSGNNRFDNILVSGTLIPEPGSAMLVLMGLAGAGAVSMRSRLG